MFTALKKMHVCHFEVCFCPSDNVGTEIFIGAVTEGGAIIVISAVIRVGSVTYIDAAVSISAKESVGGSLTCEMVSVMHVLSVS